MEPVEQAILYVRNIGQRRTVEIAAATELVRTSDLTEMIGWFAQDETETLLRFDTSNLFFHPLPSGDFALGLIFPAQSGFFSFLQSPRAFFVRILVVPPRTLLNYANNPISLYRDLVQRQKIPLFRRPPRRVQPLSVSRQTAPFDRQMVLELSRRYGAPAVARLVQLASVSLCTLFASPTHAPSLIGAILNLFPVRFRTELTFATELFFSVRIPLRLIGVSGERQRLAEQADGLGVPLVLLRDDAAPFRHRNLQAFAGEPWTRLIHIVLQTENFGFFESRLKTEATLTTVGWNDEAADGDFDELQRIGEHWLREWDNDLPPSPYRPVRSQDADESEPPMLSVDPSNAVLTAERTAIKTQSVVSPRAIIVKHPRQQELLTQVDSDLARLLFGDTTRLPMLQSAWRELQRLLPWNDKERLREEFVALIHSVMVKGRNSFSPQRPNRSVNLLDVLVVFLGE